MRILPLLITAAVTIALAVILNSTLVLPAPLGKLLSPQHGIWQNAEDVNVDFNAALSFPQLTGKTEVYFDDRLVPHIFAEQENDAYFVQGYLHAKFRLWQMELQTHAAAGRASEIIGAKALAHDREFRRLGMGYAAEKSLKEMEADPEIKAACDAYTAGVNAYITALTSAQLPIEYKLIGYQPELWTNLKTALFLKYMSYDLAGHDDDFEMTNARNFFNKQDFDLLYPLRQDSLDPIIPKGTIYAEPKVKVAAPLMADSLYFNAGQPVALTQQKPDRDNGSNNWAVSGARTKSGAPILCNDPHLGLNLPSLWYEIQISTPGFNAYGVSFPGAPSVIIGFNDSCAFGFTNGGRDVKDYYAIQFKDDSRKEYWFNNEWKQTEFRIEKIKVKDSADYIDTVAYTIFGPVMYDKQFSGSVQSNNKYYALRWTAHEAGNELRLFYQLNRAKNYSDYQQAVVYLRTPGQNCVFACKNGDIALRTQGNWPAKWKGQGDFLMPGTDSSFMWQGFIPMDETPYQYNPERGFVSSANQKPADDSTYPYYLGRDYPLYRGIIANNKLDTMVDISPEKMMALQTDNYNVFAQMALPVFIKNINTSMLDDAAKKYHTQLAQWNLVNDARSAGATIFKLLWDYFDKAVYTDEFKNAPDIIMHPFESTLLEAVLKDSAYKFVDDISTPAKESLQDITTLAFTNAVAELKQLEAQDKLEWAKYKGTHITHLAKLAPFNSAALSIGGGTHCLNAAKETHGPSWRMVIHLNAETEAYGVYPGGQSGNPGSRYYDNFINKWAGSNYYTLWMMKKEEAKSKKVKWQMSFKKA
jgi:penicillin G amidase